MYTLPIVVFVRYLSCESQLGGSLFTKPHDIGYSPWSVILHFYPNCGRTFRTPHLRAWGPSQQWRTFQPSCIYAIYRHAKI